MNLTISQVVNIVKSINLLNVEKTNNDKMMDIYFKSYDVIVKHDNAAFQMEKDRKALAEKFDLALQTTKEKEKKSDLIAQFERDYNAIPAVKKYEQTLNEVVNLDLPLFSEDELKELSQKMSKYRDILPLMVLKKKEA